MLTAYRRLCWPETSHGNHILWMRQGLGCGAWRAEALSFIVSRGAAVDSAAIFEIHWVVYAVPHWGCRCQRSAFWL